MADIVRTEGVPEIVAILMTRSRAQHLADAVRVLIDCDPAVEHPELVMIHNDLTVGLVALPPLPPTPVEVRAERDRRVQVIRKLLRIALPQSARKRANFLKPELRRMGVDGLSDLDEQQYGALVEKLITLIRALRPDSVTTADEIAGRIEVAAPDASDTAGTAGEGESDDREASAVHGNRDGSLSPDSEEEGSAPPAALPSDDVEATA